VGVDHLPDVGRGDLVEGGGDAHAGVVDHRVDPTPGIDCRLDHGSGAGLLGDAVPVGDGLAAVGHDLGGDGAGVTRVLAVAAPADTEVVDQHPRSSSSEEPGVGPTEAGVAPGAGHDDHLSVEAQFHVSPRSGQWSWQDCPPSIGMIAPVM
jgi:hypothetical protein